MSATLVIAHVLDGQVTDVTLQAVAKARSLGQPVHGLLMGQGVSGLAAGLIASGCDAVQVADQAALNPYLTTPALKVATSVIQAGGYISERSGSAPDANSVPIPKTIADQAMDAAACIGCGACAAACPNGSAMLFVSAKVTHLGLLPQGKPENGRRVLGMVRQMDEEGFGNCSNYYACEAVCPAGIPAAFIGRMNREFTAASVKEMIGMTV